jgi:hypothetical protein
MVKKILIALGIFIGILAIAVFTIAMVYEEQVKKIIVEQINKQLKAPVKVGEIKFSIIKNFPKASLIFYDVVAQSVYAGHDPKRCPQNLLTAKEISLQFNIKDVFNGNYTINRIGLSGVNLNLFIDNENIDNYHCWVTDTSKTNNSVSFKMSQIVVKEFDASYDDHKQRLSFDLLLKDAQMKGEIFNEDFALLLNSNIRINYFRYEDSDYLSHKNIALNIGLLKKNKTFSFSNAHATIEKLKLQLTGTFNKEDINFEAKGKELDIQSFLSLLPARLSKKFEDYSSEGLFGLELIIKGKQQHPQVKASFSIVNAKLGKNNSQLALHDIHLKGYYSNGRAQRSSTSGIYVNTFKAVLNKSPMAGNFSIVDFTNPFIDGSIKASFELNEVKELLKLDTFTVFKGSADLALQLSCPLEQLKQQDISKTKQGQLSGSLLLKDGSIQIMNEQSSYDHIDADLYADDNYIIVKLLRFLHGKSQVELKGELSNYQALLNKSDDKALLKAYFNSSNFELEDWLPKNVIKASNKSKSSDIYLNNIDLKLRTNIERFKFDNFIASNLSSYIYFKEKQFRFDSLIFNAMDGKAHANGAIELKDHGGFDLICDAKLSKISIHKLFEQLNNFGQKTLTDKNIAGKLSADIEFKSSWSNLNHIISESILADATVLISDGELNNFTPMNKLSKFVSVSELSHIKFNELANTISISNQKIYIPQFQIKSSAMNLYCSGIHDFNNNIDYHFKVTLSELLSKKRKRVVPKNNEFDEIEEDEEGKTTLFISMTGNIENPKIKFDKKELKQFVKDEIKNEKQTVKQLLKDEFGLFKKDKSLKDKTEKKEAKAKEFEVEWDEEPKKENTKEAKDQKSNVPKKSNKVFGGERKSTKEKPTQKEVENSDDYL